MQFYEKFYDILENYTWRFTFWEKRKNQKQMKIN